VWIEVVVVASGTAVDANLRSGSERAGRAGQVKGGADDLVSLAASLKCVAVLGYFLERFKIPGFGDVG
jgi:hypothetical protein